MYIVSFCWIIDDHSRTICVPTQTSKASFVQYLTSDVLLCSAAMSSRELKLGTRRSSETRLNSLIQDFIFMFLRPRQMVHRFLQMSSPLGKGWQQHLGRRPDWFCFPLQCGWMCCCSNIHIWNQKLKKTLKLILISMPLPSSYLVCVISTQLPHSFYF